MTNRWRRRGSIAILLLIAIGWLAGCSFSSPLLSTHDQKRILLIEKPPVMIYMSGQFDNIDDKALIEVLKVLDTMIYRPYNFNKTMSINSEIDLSHSHKSVYDSNTRIRK